MAAVTGFATVVGVIGFVVLLALCAGVVAAVAAAVRRARREHPGGGPPPGEFRRAAVLAVLAVFCIVATVGVAGILGRLFDGVAGVPMDRDVTGTARSLAFTLIAGPLAVGTWWWRWRRAGSDDGDSLVWAVFLAAISTVSLLVWSIAGLGAVQRWIADGVDRDAFATAIAWATLWAAVRWVQRRSTHRPRRLVDVAPVLGAAVGVGLGVVGCVGALADVAARLVDVTTSTSPLVDSGWWRSPVGWTAVALGGGVIWSLHWIHDGARAARSTLANTVFLVSGIVAGPVLTVVGSSMALFDASRAIWGTGVGLATAEPPIGPAVALTLVGAAVWILFERALVDRPQPVRRSAGLAEAGLGVVACATGLGITVDALLAAAGSVVTGAGVRDLLCGGLSVLVVGGALWTVAWRPGRRIEDPGARQWVGRQVYLVLVLSASTLTALATAIVVGYQVFEYVLADRAGGDLLERIRTPLGLLAAALVVVAYHLPVWRRDRAARPPAPHPALQSVVLVVAGADGDGVEELAHALHVRTGAHVAVWHRADEAAAPPDCDAVCRAVAGVRSRRALVVTGGRGEVEVVPLQD